MENIIKAFVDAGYYRARIRTLTDFDKIIGGMAWAMQVFSYDINIDVFYTDSLDLGQKIALTERLVMVLLAMNSPHVIEPHQIVGLDHVNLLPVIKWLIKRSEEVRREHEAFNRLLALRHYHRVTNTLPNRSTWCHTIPVSHLKRIDRLVSRVEESERLHGTRETTGSLVSTSATSQLVRQINQNFKDNQRVSFVKLPSLFRVENQKKNTDQSDKLVLHESRTEEDASSDDESIVGDKTAVETTSNTQDDKTLASSTNDAALFHVEHEVMNKEDQILHKELDTELLATNQKILNLMKKLDSMPSDLEIKQYQRRYIELHQQLISKNRDVKKLYDLFNSLDSTKHYLTKEINLLDSILVNLDLANNSATNRDLFMKQFQDIIMKIQNVRDDVQTRLEIIKQKCDSLNAEYASMLNNNH